MKPSDAKAIYIIGFMGSGKTTFAETYAKKRGILFCDTDTMIQKYTGNTPAVIFSTQGEDEFRRLEEIILHKTEDMKLTAERMCSENSVTPPEYIISTGGGIITREENGVFMKNTGEVWFLDVPFEVCFRRISGDTQRPNASDRTKDELYKLYKKRYPVYLKYADKILKQNDISGFIW